jgi:ribonuclease HI
VIVTDSQSVLRKVETGELRRNWTDLLMHSRIEQLTWIYCPGHAGVQGNDQTDRLAGRTPIEGVLQWDKSDLLMAVRYVSKKEGNVSL